MKSVRKTNEQFIADARLVHGDKYDYSEVEYKSSKIKVKIKCPEHGIFEQKPNGHLGGKGCSKCSGKYMDIEYFIEKANKVHNNKYDYSKSKYTGNENKIIINCKEHGDFIQSPHAHLSGNNCPKCAKRYRPTTEEFIENAIAVHGNKFNYSLVEYINNNKKIKIICVEHDIFEQSPAKHIRGAGCPKCAGFYKTTEELIKGFKLVHGDKFDYSLVNYVSWDVKVKIKCKIHGIFEQLYNDHLKGAGCPKCVGRNKITEEFINEARLVHHDKYDYSLVIYKKSNLKVKIKCPIHGVFEQRPNDHLSGYGCFRCKESKGELTIVKILDKYSVKYIREKKFDDCKNIFQLSFDFYLNEYNKLLEFDGPQHYKSVEYFGGEKALLKQQINDNIKNNFAKDNNIDLLRIRFDEINNIENIIINYLNLKT